MSETWESAMQELDENVKYCTERNIPVCTINFNVFLERMTGFRDFLRAVEKQYPYMSYSLNTYYDNFNQHGEREAGHFMYYSITITVPLD